MSRKLRQDLHTLAGPYALNALEETELRRFEKHLTHCDSCVQEVREMTETAALLGSAAARTPPESLRPGVLERVSRTRQHAPAPASVNSPRRRWWRNGLSLALAASVLIALVLGGTVVYQQQRISEMRDNEREVAAVLSAPDAQTTDAQPAEGMSARVVSSQSQGQLVFSAEGLQQLDEEDYQLWLADTDGSVRSAGLLQVAPDGSTAPMVTAGLDQAEGVAMTVEPEGGSAQPTEAPMMEMPLDT